MNKEFKSGNKAQDKQDRLCEAYDQYKAGLMSRQEYGTHLIETAEGYVKYTIKSNHLVSYAQSYEDLWQQACLCLLSKINEYDPHLSMVSTFFKYPLMDAFRDPSISRANVSLPAEFGAIRAKLQRAAERLGYETDDDGLRLMASNEDAGTLVRLTGVETRQINNTIQRLGLCEIASIGAIGEQSSEERFQSPQRSYEQKELVENVQKALARLTPFERFLAEYIATPEEERPSYRKLLTEIRDASSELYEVYQDEFPENATLVWLQQKIAEVLRKLSRMACIKKVAETSFRIDFPDTYEQGDPNDISRAIC